ncbi:MAG: class I mannose-6-phosphate isomerase [Prevotella sp.]|nr:class I mannose-6-phosphate isomerase [Prevotella sp.]
MKPFRFKPLLKQTLWGGNKIVPFKHLDSHLEQVGESWEVSGVPGNETIVSDGPFEGKSLGELVDQLKSQLVGKANYERFGNEFPLLIKFIDAREPLSIQVHPTDEIAKKQGKERGKTEMWYVMKSDADANMLVGLKKVITPEEYKAMVANDTITDIIDSYQVKEGDCFFLPAGRIHSIGKGCFLAEIQQTSDVTWRIYDFKRKDKDGNERELHTQQAAESIDYHVESNYRTNYVPARNEGVSLVQCPYFKTFVYDVTEPLTIDLSSLDSFIITIVVDGEGTLTDDEGNVEQVKAGDTLLFPATTKQIKVTGTLKFLETYV